MCDSQGISHHWQEEMSFALVPASKLSVCPCSSPVAFAQLFPPHQEMRTLPALSPIPKEKKFIILSSADINHGNRASAASDMTYGSIVMVTIERCKGLAFA